MKVALVILHADPERGGAERYTFDLAAALARLGAGTSESGEGSSEFRVPSSEWVDGIRVSLVASSFGARPAGVDCVLIPAEARTRTGRYLAFLKGLDAHLNEARYDIVHAMLPVRRCDLYHPHAGLAVEAIATGHLKHATRLKQAMASLGNRLNVRRNVFARVEQSLLRQASPPGVICLSDYVKATVQRHYPNLDKQRLPSLFNSVDLGRFDPDKNLRARADLRGRFGIGADELAGLIIAQDFARKGLGEAIDALARASGKLIVVGKESIEAYQRRAVALGVAERVIFAGATTDPHAFYQASDYFVLPTRHDPCSLVVLEALAMGLPVISTRQNGACEIMTDGVHGFVLESADDRTGLVAAMKTMANESRRLKMREECLALRPKLAYESHLDALLNIYSQVLKTRRSEG